MNFEFYSQTDTGRVRTNNEDSVALDESCAVAVLADGMDWLRRRRSRQRHGLRFHQGRAGPVAARGFGCRQRCRRQARDGHLCRQRANQAIFGAANSNPTYAGMGTTLVLGVFRPGRLLMGHIGDSRGYRWRNGVLQQITKDHSLLQEQIDAGMLTPEQAQYAANKNLVTRALGVEDMVLLETHQHDVVPGDVYLMCSDGLSDMLRDAQIAEIMAAHPSCPTWGKPLSRPRTKRAGGIISRWCWPAPWARTILRSPSRGGRSSA